MYYNASSTLIRTNSATDISLKGNTVLHAGNYTSYAATSGHTHDGRYIRWSNSTADTGAMSWGTLTSANGYNILAHCSSSDGGDMGWCYKGGQISYQVDGFFYQNEGRYKCIDEGNISSQSVTSAKNLSSNYSSSNLSSSPFTASTFEYGIITSGSDGLLSDLDGYSQATYINLPWTTNSFGGQLLFGTNTGKIGYRTRHSGTWTAVKLLATISDITWDNVGSKPNVAIRQSANNFIIAGDELNFIPDNYNNRVRFNCYSPSRNGSSTVTEYWFDNGHAGTIAKILSSGEYTGTISWSNVTGKPTLYTNNYLPENTPHYFRDPNASGWRGGMIWGSAGSESMSFVVVNGGTRFQFVCGSDIASWNSSTWQSASPACTIAASSATFAGSVYSNSDRHLKKNISSIHSSSLDQLFSISDKILKKFIWKQTGKVSYGFIAQELEQHIPEAVTVETNGVKTVSYDIAYAKIIASLVNEIKKLKKALEDR